MQLSWSWLRLLCCEQWMSKWMNHGANRTKMISTQIFTWCITKKNLLSNLRHRFVSWEPHSKYQKKKKKYSLFFHSPQNEIGTSRIFHFGWSRARKQRERVRYWLSFFSLNEMPIFFLSLDDCYTSFILNEIMNKTHKILCFIWIDR